jgi:hypothetical protein
MIRREISSSSKCRGLAAGFSLAILLCLQTGFAAASDKPRVAIKMPKVGEGVSKYSNRYLNLSTILAEMERSLQQTVRGAQSPGRSAGRHSRGTAVCRK